MLALKPYQVLSYSKIQLVDMRSQQERYSGVGFIPGSLSIPFIPDPTLYAQTVTSMVDERTPVLLCHNGRRARACALSMASAFKNPPGYLVGGILRWKADGLPLSGRLTPGQLGPPEQPGQPELQLNAAPASAARRRWSPSSRTDPLAVLRECFIGSRRNYDTRELRRVHHLLDHAAIASLEMGSPLKKVADNIDGILARLPGPGEAKHSSSLT